MNFSTLSSFAVLIIVLSLIGSSSIARGQWQTPFQRDSTARIGIDYEFGFTDHFTAEHIIHRVGIEYLINRLLSVTGALSYEGHDGADGDHNGPQVVSMTQTKVTTTDFSLGLKAFLSLPFPFYGEMGLIISRITQVVDEDGIKYGLLDRIFPGIYFIGGTSIPIFRSLWLTVDFGPTLYLPNTTEATGLNYRLMIGHPIAGIGLQYFL